MNEYFEIKIPTNLKQDNSKMTLEDIDQYFNWFMSIKEERLKILCKSIFKSDEIIISEDKLQAIFYFLKDNIKFEERSTDEVSREIKKLPKHLKNINNVAQYKLIEPSLSLIFDISIYIGELLKKEIVDLIWMPEKDEELVDYAYPILKNNNGNRLCPNWVISVLANQLCNGDVHEDRLVNLYQIWKNALIGKPKDYMAMINSWTKKKK